MLTAQDLHGVMGMMPAFATADAASIQASSTIDVHNLEQGVNRIIEDGIDVIATTGSFGEFHTLLDDEFTTLARTTVRRAPPALSTTRRHSPAQRWMSKDTGGTGRTARPSGGSSTNA